MKTFSFLAFLIATTLSAAPKGVDACGGQLSIAIKGNDCGETKDIDTDITKVIYDSMIDAVEEITGERVEASEGQFVTKARGELATNPEGYTRADIGAGRNLVEQFDVEAQGHRELLNCDGLTWEECTASYPSWMCCQFCFGGCRRRGLAALMNGLPRELQDRVVDDACSKAVDAMQASIRTQSCLEGAEILKCEWKEGVRKEGVTVGAAEPVQSSESGASVLSVVVPTAIGVAGWMA